MSDHLEEQSRKVSIDDRNITNLRFVDHLHTLAQEEQELEGLFESLAKPAQGSRWRSVPGRQK